jgi:hypothetical protein
MTCSLPRSLEHGRTRVFSEDGHWQFGMADPAWRSLHYIAGGHFYAIGAALDANRDDANVGAPGAPVR